MKNSLVLFLFFLTHSISSQNETNNWYFGNKAALDFNSGNLSLKSDSQMNTPAGCSTISDASGNLLFYTNGETIWNKNHQIMENGEGLFGDKEHTQSTIIIPKPESDEIFYVFTLQQAISGTTPTSSYELNYSEIEISNQYPLGNVINKNSRLRQYTSQRITAIHHKDEKSIWLITFGKTAPDANQETFMVYKIDASQISSTPIISNVSDTNSSSGQMKISPDGKKIVTASVEETRVDFYNFDTETGIVQQDLTVNMALDFSSGYVPYGVAFSQDSKMLYLTTSKYGENSSSFYLFQQDLTVNFTGFDDPPIGNEIFKSNAFLPGSLQLGSNGNVYVALKGNPPSELTVIGEIQNADKVFTDDSFLNLIDLVPNSSNFGLPNFIQSYFFTRIITQDECVFENVSFSLTPSSLITNIIWDFGDGNTASGENVTHNYTNPGEYVVKATLTKNGNAIDLYKKITVYSLPNLTPNQELVECDDNFDGLSTFNLNSIKPKITNPALNEELFFYLSLDDLTRDIQITNPEQFQNTIINQEVFVKVVNENNCAETTSFRVNSKFIQLENIPDFFACENSDDISGDNKAQFNSDVLQAFVKNQITVPNLTSLEFYPTLIDAQTNLNKFEGNFITSAGPIYLKIQEQDLSCGGIKAFNLVINSETKINILNSYTICFNPSLKPPVIISADNSNERFEWRNSLDEVISINQNFTLDTLGEFSLTVYKTENGILCSNKKFFNVRNPEKPIFADINVNTEDSTNNIIDVNINGNSSYEFSLDNVNFNGNSTSYTFNNVKSGLRTIYIRDINNCEEPIETKITVIGFKKFFTPNNDGNNDFWNINGISSDEFKSINIIIFNRFGKTIKEITNFDDQGWDGTFNGKKLANSNYWFKATIIDNDNNLIEETGNFSLISY